MITILTHIPKTGGTTLNRMIARDNPSKQVAFWEVDSEEDIEKNLKNIKIIAGHFPYGLHTRFNLESVRYGTILREPLDQLLSFFNFIKRDPAYPLHERVKEIGFETFLKERMFFEFFDWSQRAVYPQDNGNIRFLLNKLTIPYGGITKKHLSEAKEILENQFIVGIMEMYDKSLILFKEFLPHSFKCFSHERINVAPKREKKTECSEKALRLFHKQNALDIDLYHYGFEIFESQWQKIAKEEDALFDKYQRKITKNPDDITAYINCGFVAKTLGWQKAAEATYLNTLEYFQYEPEICVQISREYYLLGNQKEARESLRQGMEKDNTHEPLYTMLGKLCLEEGDYLEAINLFKTAIQLNPKNADSYTSLGVAFYRLDQKDMAGKLFQKAITINPYCQEAALNLQVLSK